MHYIEHKNTYNVTTDTLFIDSEGFHCKLHPIKASGLPDKICSEVMSTFGRNAFCPSQF